MKPTAPKDDPSYLPETVPECHAVIQELRTNVKSLEERVAELQKQLRRRNRMTFGKSSAQVSGESLTGTGKTVYNAYKAELEEERAKLQLVPDEKFHGGGGRNLPTGVVERPVEHKITDEALLACPGCGKQRQVFGFKQPSYQLEILKTVFEVLKHIEYSYSCTDCDGHIVSASKPYQPIAKGLAAPGLIGHIGIAKFDWHLPLYRQERIYRALGVPIARSSMSRWLKEGADILGLIVERMHQLSLQSRLILSDATKMPVIKKGLGKTHQAFTWIYRDERYIIYDFTWEHNQTHPARMLPDFDGVLLTDGAQVFNPVIEGGATKAGCSAHAFRYLEDARKEDPEQVDYALAIMKSLFDVEKLGAQLSEEERRALRAKYSKPRLAALRAWIDELAPEVLPKSALGDAITYLNNQWDALCMYANTGFVPSHNNASENGLRPAVLGRRNWLFAGSVQGGHTAAIWMSIIQTCRLHSIDPFEYLKDVFTRLPSLPTSAVDDFLPDRWKALREAEA